MFLCYSLIVLWHSMETVRPDIQ
ncbi:MAG: hypothetical protein RLZZ522_459, partial [Verrucomicrobiota bacterium]